MVKPSAKIAVIIDKIILTFMVYWFFDWCCKDMNKVCEKINYYIENNKHILIMGDYDTDGISASAILYKYFEKNYKKELN